MDPKGMQALAESAAAYERRHESGQLGFSEEEMAGQLTLASDDSQQFYGMFERKGIASHDGAEVIFCDTSGRTDPQEAMSELLTLGVDHFTGPLMWHDFETNEGCQI